VLAWLRQRLPLVYSGLDLSPLLVLLAIVFLKNFLIASLLDLAHRIC
jgi:YggT family protein